MLFRALIVSLGYLWFNLESLYLLNSSNQIAPDCIYKVCALIFKKFQEACPRYRPPPRVLNSAFVPILVLHFIVCHGNVT